MYEWQKRNLRYRRLAFALKEIRDTENSILDIALNYGFLPRT